MKNMEINNIEFIGCSRTTTFTEFQDYGCRNDQSNLLSNNNTLFQFGNKYYSIILPTKSWALNIEKDSVVCCPFCESQCEIVMTLASRMWNAEKIPMLSDCNCDMWVEYKKRLADKCVRLSHENFKCIDYKFNIALYNDTLFIWSRLFDQSQIFQSKKFFDYVLSDDVGFVQGDMNFIFPFRLEHLIEPVTKKINYQNVTFGKEVLSTPYKVNLNRDIDIMIKKAKETAQEDDRILKGQFHFPPPNRVPDNFMFSEKQQINLNVKSHNFENRIDVYKNENDDIECNFTNSTFDKVLAIQILKFCSAGSVCSWYRVNKWWREVCRNDILWKHLLVRDFDSIKELRFGGYRELYKNLHIDKMSRIKKDVFAFDPHNTNFSHTNFAHDLFSQNVHNIFEHSSTVDGYGLVTSEEEEEEEDILLNNGDIVNHLQQLNMYVDDIQLY